MKIISKVLNLIMIAVMFVLATVVEFTVYNLIALPAGNTSTVAFVSTDTDNDGYDDNVSYFDTFAFLGDDLAQSVTREPRYLVRSWFKWDWWQNGMKWADIAIESVIGVFVPIVAPVYEVNEIQYYYTSDTPVVGVIGNGEYTVNGIYVLSESELAMIDSTKKNYNQEFIDNFEAEHGTFFAYAEFRNGLGGTQVSGGGIYKITKGKVNELATWSKYGEEANYTSSSWKKENSSFINVLMKINKYNSTSDGHNVYTKWVYKFMEQDEDRTIKASVSSLYFQFYLAVILAIWFCYQNHITVDRDEYGGVHVCGGFRHRKPKARYSDDCDDPTPHPHRRHHFFKHKKK